MDLSVMNYDNYQCHICGKCIKGAAISPGCDHNYHNTCMMKWFTTADDDYHRDLDTTDEKYVTGAQKCPICRNLIRGFAVKFLKKPSTGYPVFPNDEDDDNDIASTAPVEQVNGNNPDDDVVIVGEVPANRNRVLSTLVRRNPVVRGRGSAAPIDSLPQSSSRMDSSLERSVVSADSVSQQVMPSVSTVLVAVNDQARELQSPDSRPSLAVNGVPESSSTGSGNDGSSVVAVNRPHIRVRNNPLVCEYCNQTFNTQPAKSNHVQAKHKPVNKPCPVCKKEFSCTKYLNDHKRRKQHYGKK